MLIKVCAYYFARFSLFPITFFCILFSLVGCAQVDECDHDCRVEKIYKDCQEKTGYTIIHGVNEPECVKVYSDAGKRCKDTSECEGRCIVEKTKVGNNADIQGICEKHFSYGCDSYVVKNGKALFCIES